MMMEAVGIGCVWFAQRPDANGEIDIEHFNPSDHIEQVRIALEELDSIRKVEISGNRTLHSVIWGLEDNDQDNTFFPLFSDLRISFEITVPTRFHSKYLWSERVVDDENFYVDLVFKGVMPVAYIRYPVSGAESEVRNYSPSRAVVVVRKYLEEKLSDHPRLKFQTMGPSPFHADVFLDAAQGEELEEDKSFAGDGYHTLYFRYDAATPADRLELFIHRNHSILSAFYSVVRWRNHGNNLRKEVTDGALGLLRSFKQRSRFGSGLRRSEIDSVYHALLEEKLNRVTYEQYQEELKREPEIDPDSLFYPMIEAEFIAKSDMPDEDIRELIIMLEERRRGYFQNLATLVSGLFGALLGAAVGAGLTYQFAQPAKMTAVTGSNEMPSSAHVPPWVKATEDTKIRTYERLTFPEPDLRNGGEGQADDAAAR